MEGRVPLFEIIFFIGLGVFFLIIIINSVRVHFGRCVKCRRFRKKYDEHWWDKRTADNNWKGYTFYYCKECRYRVPNEVNDIKKYFTEIFEKNIIPQKLKNKDMRKWIINIFLIVLFYEILTITPKLIDKLLN